MATRGEGRNERRGTPVPLRSLRSTHHRDWGWLEALDAWHPGAVAVTAAAVFAAVAALDWVAGGFAVTMLYLVPVALMAWRSGLLGGALWATAATAAWGAAAVAAHGEPPGAIGWDALTRLATFLVAAALVAALRRERDTVRALAGTDHLTGVHDAHSFQELVELERSRALRYNRPFTLAYLDVDGFRTVNEEWGHTAGDQALRLVATTIREHIRSMDSVCRMGGDEFALLFPETGRGAAAVALEKIQGRLVAATGERTLALTFTIGAVICVGAPESVDALVRRAEALMYSAKDDGGGTIRAEVLEENFGIEAILQRS